MPSIFGFKIRFSQIFKLCTNEHQQCKNTTTTIINNNTTNNKQTSLTRRQKTFQRTGMELSAVRKRRRRKLFNTSRTKKSSPYRCVCVCRGGEVEGGWGDSEWRVTSKANRIISVRSGRWQKISLQLNETVSVIGLHLSSRGP